MRMPPGTYWAQLGAAMGGEVTPVSFPEIYLSLQTGVIQAQDNPLPTDVADKFYQVTKEIVLTNHVIEPVQPTINDVTWNKLSPAEQTDLMHAITLVNAANNKEVANQQRTDINFLRKQGLAVYTPDIASFRKPALKSFLCDPAYRRPLDNVVRGLLGFTLKLSGATAPSC